MNILNLYCYYFKQPFAAGLAITAAAIVFTAGSSGGGGVSSSAAVTTITGSDSNSNSMLLLESKWVGRVGGTANCMPYGDGERLSYKIFILSSGLDISKLWI